MDKVVSIYHRRFLGAYRYAQDCEAIPDEILFLTGVLFTVGLPQLVFFVYGGVTPLIAFAVSAVVGSIWGLVLFYLFPYQIPSCINSGSVRQAPPREDTRRKKAA